MKKNNLRLRNKRSKFIILGLLLLAITVGYAVLSISDSISGISKINNASWSVHFDNIEVNNNSVAIVEENNDKAATIDPEDNTKVNFSVTLDKPGNFYEFTVDAVNDGSMDAMIDLTTSMIKIGDNEPVEITDETLPKYLKYKVSYLDGGKILKNHELKANTHETYKVRVEYSRDVTGEDLPDEEVSLDFSFTTNYKQKDDKAVAKPENIECTYNGELVQGAEYTNGQYTYRYMQEYGGSTWNNINNDGWGVTLTDKESTDPVTTKLCSTINEKPIVSMAYMFNNSKTTTIDTSSFNTSDVTNMTGMFYNVNNIEEIDVSSFDTSKVTVMPVMFYGDSSLKSINLSNFNTSNVTTVSCMFSGDTSLTDVNLDNWDMSRCSGSGGVFDSSVKKISMKNWIIPENFSHWLGRAWCASGVEEVDVTGWDLSNARNLSGLFADSSKLKTIKGLNTWNTSAITNMSQMFYGTAIEELDLSRFNTSSVVDMSFLFYNCNSIVNLDLTSFDTSKVTSMNSMFYGCSALEKVLVEDSFVTTLLTGDNSSTNMFSGATSLVGGAGTVYDANHIDKEYARVDGGETNPGYFSMKDKVTITFDTDGGSLDIDDIEVYLNEKIGTLPVPEKKGYVFLGWFTDKENGNKINENTIMNSNLTIYAHYRESEEFTVTFNPNGGTIENNTKDAVEGEEVGLLPIPKYRGKLFRGWYTDINSGTKINTSTIINNDVTFYAHWVDEVKCTYDGELVQGAEYINGQYTYRYMQERNLYYGSNAGLKWEDIDIDGWGAVLTDEDSEDPVTTALCSSINDKPIVSMSTMFSDSKATSIDLSSFNTSQVVNMRNMFIGAVVTDLEFDSFDTSNVTDMMQMFCSTSISSLDLYTFDTSNVTNMELMFYSTGVSTSSLDLRSFDTSNVTSMDDMFYRSKYNAIDTSSFNTSNVTDMYSMFGGCENIKELDLSNFDTSKNTSFSAIFSGMKSVETINISNWNFGNYNNSLNFSDMGIYNGGNPNLKEVIMDNVIFPENSSYFFMGLDCVDNLKLSLKNVDTSNVINMEEMFYSLKVNELDLSDFNTSKVRNMRYMFFNMKNIKKIDLNSFDTYNVTDMSDMFVYLADVEVIDLSSFDTHKVKTMNSMFAVCPNLKTIIATDAFVTDNVESSAGMFSQSPNIIGGAGTIFDSNHIDKEYARLDGGEANPGYFSKRGSIEITLNSNTTEIDNQVIYGVQGEKIGRLPIPVRTKYLFTGWYTDRVNGTKITKNTIVNEDVTYYAHWADAIPYTVIFNPSGGELEEASRTVYEQHQIGSLPVPTRTDYVFLGWYTGLLDGIKIEDDFIINDNIELYGRWRNEKAMFNVGSDFNRVIKWIANNNTNMTSSSTDSKIKSIARAYELPSNFVASSNNKLSDYNSDHPIYGWFDSSSGTLYYYTDYKDVYLNENSGYMFRNMTALESLPGFVDVNTSDVTSMRNMFSNTGASAQSVNFDFSKWDTSNVTNFSEMFLAAYWYLSSFEIDISNWDTSSAIYFSSMFESLGRAGCRTFSLGDLSNWSNSNVYDMSFMFANTCPTSNWTSLGTLNVQGDIRGMFSGSYAAKVTLNLKSPIRYFINTNGTSGVFNNAATYSNALITVNYANEIDNIDDIIATKSDNSNVVKGSQLD